MARMNEVEPAYRAPMAARSGERRSRRLMLIGAAATVGVFAAVIGLRELVTGGHGPREVPMVSADDRPTRVRPDNPGGMTVPNQDKLIFERAAGRSTAPQQAALAPPPEAPQALPRPVPPPAPVAAPQAPPAAPAPAPPAQQAAARLPAPTPATQAPSAQAPSAQAPVAPNAPAAGAPAATTPPPSGRVAVQLAAVGTHQEAMAEWERLKRRAPEFLGNRRPQVVPLERDGKTFFRLRTDGFADQAAARGFCEQLRARGLSCFVPSA